MAWQGKPCVGGDKMRSRLFFWTGTRAEGAKEPDRGGVPAKARELLFDGAAFDFVAPLAVFVLVMGMLRLYVVPRS